MNFLYPGFLFALFSIAIPIIIHLFNFRRFKKIYFSNVRFLKEIKAQHAANEKLKNLLILISRILAITFLVLAFARPFIPAAGTKSAAQDNIVSIYIDNSFSMEAVNKDGSLLDEAKRKAKEIVQAYQLNDRFQLLTNDFEGKHQRLLNADEFLLALNDVKISAASRTLQQVINRQQAVFTGSRNRIVFLISDFQKGFAGTQKLKVDRDVQFQLVKLNANLLPNVAVDSVALLSPVHQKGSSEKLIVRLKNFGDEDAKNIPLKLSINGQQKAVQRTSVPAAATVVDTLSFSGLDYGWQNAIIEIKDYPLTFDDQLNFSFKVNALQKVLSISPMASQKYIKALFSADPYFELTEMPESNINYAAFSDFSLIVLNGIEQPSSGLADALKRFVANGGSVVILPNLDVEISRYQQFLNQLQLPSPEQLQTQPTKVAQIELKNNLFKDVFESLPKQLDLPQVKRYFTYKQSANRSQENLLQLPANNFFFARFPQRAGQFFLSAVGLNPKDGNLAEHPVFVPLMYKIAFSSVKEQALYYTVFKDNLLESSKISLNKNENLKLVADNFEIIPEIRQGSDYTRLYTADQVKKAGFYELKKGDSLVSTIAFNDNRKESDMHYDSKADLEELVDNKQVSIINPAKDAIQASVSQKNKGTELWKLCLILSIVFLAIEVLLIRFFNPYKKANT